MKHVRSSTLGLLAAALAAACNSSPSSDAVELGAPNRATAFPSQVYVGELAAQARIYSDHEAIFGVDLIDDYGIVPIGLRIGLRDAAGRVGQARISREDLALRLYLPDGTPLSSVSYDELPIDESREVEDRIAQQALKSAPLVPFGDAPEGMVFFRLDDPASCEWTGGFGVRTTKAGLVRDLDLCKSLCAFNVTLERSSKTVFVGLERDSRRGR